MILMSRDLVYVEIKSNLVASINFDRTCLLGVVSKFLQKKADLIKTSINSVKAFNRKLSV